MPQRLGYEIVHAREPEIDGLRLTQARDHYDGKPPPQPARKLARITPSNSSLSAGFWKKATAPDSRVRFFVAFGIAGGENDHRNRRKRWKLLQVFQHGKSVARRQPEIEDDQVGPFFLSHGDGGITVTNIHGVEVIGPQTQTQGLSEIGIIIHDHNLCSIYGLLVDVTFSRHFCGAPFR
jgi:hypothetical protein